MEILVLQHNEIVGPGLMRKIAAAHGAGLQTVRLHENDAMPAGEVEAGKFAGVVALGSRATAYLPETNPRYDEEVEFFRFIAKSSVPSFFMCYSMQLFCLANGGEAKQNPKGKEIGFKDVTITEEGKRDRLFRGVRSPFASFQSHQDIVTRLPKGAVRLAYSQKTENQAAVFRGIHYVVQSDSQMAEKQEIERWAAVSKEWLEAAGVDGMQLLKEFDAKEKALQGDFSAIFSNFLGVCASMKRE